MCIAKDIPKIVLDKKINVRFDTNVNKLPWNFKINKNVIDVKIGEVNTNDPQNLYNARVDTGKTNSTSYAAFDPIGGGVTEFGSSTMGLDIKGEVGKLKVSTE